MNYLCIDYGRKHLGLAVASTQIAEPLMTIAFNDWQKLLPDTITQKSIDSLVLGLSEGQMAQETKHFGQELSQRLGLPVYYHDETLTSQTATKKLRHSSKKKRRGPDHHYAAALILQDFLDSRTI